MRDLHVWNLLALHVPNLLPQTVFGSHFPRRAGRLIWASLFFLIGVGIAMWLVRRPKPAEPATWAQTFIGALGVWVLFALGYGVIPSEWISFGNSYLNFDSASYLLHKNRILPFDITRDKFVDLVATLIYGVVLVLNVYLFAAWQKRKVAEPVAEVEEGAAPTSAPRGPLARLRGRREERTSAYGRPVTTSES